MVKSIIVMGDEHHFTHAKLSKLSPYFFKAGGIFHGLVIDVVDGAGFFGDRAAGMDERMKSFVLLWIKAAISMIRSLSGRIPVVSVS